MAGAIQPDTYCLGLEWLGVCPPNTEPLFTLGEAVAVLVLFFGIRELSNPITRMRWRTRWITDKHLLILLRLGIYLALLAAALRVFPTHRLPIVHYPIFWEFLAGAILISGGMTLVYCANTPTRLSKRNANTFLSANVHIIATGDENDLRELGSEIRDSLDLVAEQCRTYLLARTAAEQGQDGGAEVKPDELARVSFTLLDTWSDQRFCSTIVRLCPGTLIDVFRISAERGVLGYLYHFGRELIHQAVADERSILHREEGYSGFGRHKRTLHAIFGDIRVLRSKVGPLGAWEPYRDQGITALKIERWGDAMQIALKTIIKERDSWGSAYPIRAGLETLNSVTLSLLANKDQEKIRLTYRIDHAFEEVIEMVANSKINIEEDINPDTYQESKDHSIHGGIAKELFNFYGQVSSINDWSVLHSATVGSFMALFPHSDGEVSKDLKAMQVRVVHHIREKLADNLDPETTYYPAITKLLLTLASLRDTNRQVCCALEYDLLVHFKREFTSKFAALWRRNEKFASDMLPSDMTYDPVRFVLRKSRFRRQDAEEFQLDAPAS